MIPYIPFASLLLIILVICLVSSEEKIKGCQAEEGGVYMHGEAWSNGCWINSCKAGFVNSLLAATCCRANGAVYNNNSTWDDECWIYTCLNGDIKKELKPNMCALGQQLPLVPEIISNDLEIITRKRRAAVRKINCLDQAKEQEVSKPWNEKCYHKNCYRGQLTWEVNSKCCDIDGVAYPDGAAWSEKCSLFFCEAGASRKQKDASCCKLEGEMYPHRHEWDEDEEDCYSKVCKAGQIKRGFKKSCCKHDGEIYADGEYWQTKNHKWFCRNGERVKLDDSEEYCKFDSKIYKTGEEWEKDCYIYTCDRSFISSKTDLDCMKISGNECDDAFDNYRGEMNEVCASFGGPCNNGQGVCRSNCTPGEISIGQCDGRACFCCGMANAANWIFLPILNQLVNPVHGSNLKKYSSPILNQVPNPSSNQIPNSVHNQVSNPTISQFANPVLTSVLKPASNQISNPLPNQYYNLDINQIPNPTLNQGPKLVSNQIPNPNPKSPHTRQSASNPTPNSEINQALSNVQKLPSITAINPNTAINITSNSIISDEIGNFTAKQQDCTFEDNIIGNGKSIVDQNKCLTYMCSSGILLKAEIDNC